MNGRTIVASDPIHVNDDSDLPARFDEAATRPVRFERKGIVYYLAAVDREDEDLWTNYDAEAVREAVRKAAGSLPDMDADKVIADLYEWRRIGSRPAWRPRIPSEIPIEGTDDNGF